jgi:lipopolysaccharide heptosyltransferase II
MKHDFKNILIVRTDRLGDVILTTPAIKCLRKNYPKARLTLLISPSTYDIVCQNPYLDEILFDDRKKKHNGLLGFSKLVYEIRKKEFDLAIVYHTKKRSNLLCFLAGIPLRIGFKNNKFGSLLNWPVKDDRNTGRQHESYFSLDILREMGIPVGELDFHVSVSSQAEKWFADYLTAHHVKVGERLIAVHIGSSDPARRWPTYRFAELMSLLGREKRNKFVLVGDHFLQEAGQNLEKQTNVPLLNLIGKTTLSQLTSVVNRCDMLISNDSGPVHLATGLNRPVVAIFTRNQPGINPERWRPLGEKARYVSVPQDTSISFAKSREIDSKLLEVIRAEEVFEVVDHIFKLC